MKRELTEAELKKVWTPKAGSRRPFTGTFALPLDPIEGRDYVSCLIGHGRTVLRRCRMNTLLLESNYDAPKGAE